MTLADAKTLIGRMCSVTWVDRRGAERNLVSRVHDVANVKMYGAYLVLDCDDIQLDRVTRVHLLAEDGSEETFYQRETSRRIIAA